MILSCSLTAPNVYHNFLYNDNKLVESFVNEQNRLIRRNGNARTFDQGIATSLSQKPADRTMLID
jgi:hypothetical protein